MREVTDQLVKLQEHLDAQYPPVTAHEAQTRTIATALRSPAAPSTSRSSWIAAFAAGFIVLILVGAVVLLAHPFSGEEPAPVVTHPPQVVTTASVVTPKPLSAIILTPTPGVDPVRVSTVIGDVEFTTHEFPAGLELSGPVATPFGLVAIGDSALRWSIDGVAWEGVLASDEPDRLTVVDDGLIVYDGKGAAEYAWNGDTWMQVARLELDDIDQIAFGRHGAVAVSGGTIFYSADGVHFTEAEHGPSKDVFVAAEDVPLEDRDFGDCRATFGATTNEIRAVLATHAGFVAFTSASHPHGEVCDPLAWFSDDGNTWDLASVDSPFGKMAVVRDPAGIAERDGRYVAIGEIGGQGRVEIQGAIWVSDDGRSWQRFDGPQQTGLVVAGEMGWMLIGLAGPEEAPYEAAWFSNDGERWDGPYQLPAVGITAAWSLPQFAIGSDTIFGIGDREIIPVVGRLQD